MISIKVAPGTYWLGPNVLETDDDRSTRPENVEPAPERILEGIHRVQALAGEAKRLILNPAPAEPPAIAAPPALRAERAENLSMLSEPKTKPPNPAD